MTSLFGFLPVAIGIAIELFKKKGERPKFIQWVMAVVAMFGLCFLLINLPENLLGRENSPYAFTDRGYYEQYAEQYEADTGFEY